MTRRQTFRGLLALGLLLALLVGSWPVSLQAAGISLAAERGESEGGRLAVISARSERSWTE